MGSCLGSWLPGVATPLFALLLCLCSTVSRPELPFQKGQLLHAGPLSRAVGGAVHHKETPLGWVPLAEAGWTHEGGGGYLLDQLRGWDQGDQEGLEAESGPALSCLGSFLA